jgi:hypothetical protein
MCLRCRCDVELGCVYEAVSGCDDVGVLSAVAGDASPTTSLRKTTTVASAALGIALCALATAVVLIISRRRPSISENNYRVPLGMIE